ncbi:hypothetical protein [Sphingomonas sp.]|uniref:hypothetical protein n=1 Tax=Sphingomonas sp. TaxID=28214 RepID=UPI003B3A255C
MEVAAFRSPLTEHELAELGRATVNWGLVDLFAEALILMIRGNDRENVVKQMIVPKIRMLRELAPEVGNDDARREIGEFCDQIDDLASMRNHATHGFWGWHLNLQGRPAAAHSHKAPGQPIKGEDITHIADQIAIATRKANDALDRLIGFDSTGVDYPRNLYFGSEPPGPVVA